MRLIEIERGHWVGVDLDARDQRGDAGAKRIIEGHDANRIAVGGGGCVRTVSIRNEKSPGKNRLVVIVMRR